MNRPLREWRVGQSAASEVAITEDLVAAFAEFSGDRNPLHLDQSYASRTNFRRRVAHGMSYGALFSRLIGMEIPGPGALWVEQSFRFAKPVFIGDRLRLSVEVSAVHPSTGSLTLSCRATNQMGEVVMSGTGEVMILETSEPAVPSALPARRVAIVTGGARGIGAGICRALVADGFHVALTYRSARVEAEALVAELGNAIALQSDAANAGEARDLTRKATAALGNVDTLVLNAGGDGLYGPVADGDFEPFVRHINGQLAGVHALVSAAAPGMAERGFGRIIAIGSTYAIGAPPPGMSPYVVGKAALVAFIRCVAVEYGAKGIRANIVAPGMTDTSLIAAVPDRVRKVAAAQNPSRRLAQVDDVAGAVAFLASRQADYVNGHTLVVSGGATMP